MDDVTKTQNEEKQEQEALKRLCERAENGDAQAQFELGKCYAQGSGVEQSMSDAIEWYRKAAEQGNADAQDDLGLCYLHGK